MTRLVLLGRVAVYIDAAYCYRPNSIVCLSVCLHVCVSVTVVSSA